MKLEIGYGEQPQQLHVPDANVVAVLEPNALQAGTRGIEAVRQALATPIGTPQLKDCVSPGEKIAIVTSDITRPMPSKTVLPCLLDALREAGIREQDITIVFALGSHRLHTRKEKEKLVGPEILRTIACVDSNAEDFLFLGRTSSGTPVEISRSVAMADKRICLGNIEYHYFAGYSGGAKAIMPGASTREAIQANHRFMVRPEAVAGRLNDNPVRTDLEDAISFCPIDFILNVVLDAHKEIVYAVAGHYIEAHRQGCRFLDTLYGVPIPELADIVIVSQGGSPKDINLYQTQKALDNAKHAVKKGGIIILVGSCKEGLGEAVFEDWITAAPTPQALVDRISSDFQLGGHKAAAIALVLQNAEIFLVSEMEPDFVRTLFMRPFASVQSALDAALAQKGDEATIMIMPYGGSTLPLLQQPGKA